MGTNVTSPQSVLHFYVECMMPSTDATEKGPKGPATGPSPQPDESSPQAATLFP